MPSKYVDVRRIEAADLLASPKIRTDSPANTLTVARQMISTTKARNRLMRAPTVATKTNRPTKKKLSMITSNIRGIPQEKNGDQVAAFTSLFLATSKSAAAVLVVLPGKELSIESN
jgi:hypothetical protein